MGHSRGYFFARALVVLALVLSSVVQSYAALTQDEQHLLSCINVSGMTSTIERLCSDAFAGRRAGSPQQALVVDYLASKFGSDGLSAFQTAGFDGYKQPLTMRYSLVKSEDDIKATLTYNVAGKQKSRVFAYRQFNGRGGLDLHSDVVFVGYGTHDDFASLDVTGKIVFWLPGQPKGAHPLTDYHKMLAAYQRGALACLTCRGSGNEPMTNVGLSGSIADFPYIAIDRKIASELLHQPDLSRLAVGTHGASIRLQVTPVCDPDRPTYNIVGVLPGTDLADEIVILGAHFDHLGCSACGIFRGADDNASGTSVVLEVARAIAGSGLKPRRTIVFASWTGEEAGLIGSNYFAGHPPIPLQKVVSNIELDMVGAGTPDAFMTTGATAYPAEYQYLASSGADLGLKLTPDVIVGASDHLAFVRKKVPTSLIYSAGEHPNYHSTRDVPAAINRQVLGSAAKLTLLSVWRAANG